MININSCIQKRIDIIIHWEFVRFRYNYWDEYADVYDLITEITL